jgi:hypothetical protein
MRFKELNYKFLMSIPHLSFLFDMRRYQRYEPNEGLRIEINVNDTKIEGQLLDVGIGGIEGQLLDVGIGGMRIMSTDKRIEDSKSISLSTNDIRVNLPCRSIRKITFYYGIKFGRIDRQDFADLEYFIDHFTHKSLENGPTEIMR